MGSNLTSSLLSIRIDKYENIGIEWNINESCKKMVIQSGFEPTTSQFTFTSVSQKDLNIICFPFFYSTISSWVWAPKLELRNNILPFHRKGGLWEEYAWCVCFSHFDWFDISAVSFLIIRDSHFDALTETQRSIRIVKVSRLKIFKLRQKHEL